MKQLSFLLCLLIFSQSTFAVSGLKEALDQYHYSVTVEWDQRDQSALRAYDQELESNIKSLMDQGLTSEQIMGEVLTFSQDKNLNQEVVQLLEHHKLQRISTPELIQTLQEKADSLRAQGASWHPVLKIALGLVITYAVLKAVMLIIYYWDTEPYDCAQHNSCNPPPKAG